MTNYDEIMTSSMKIEQGLWVSAECRKTKPKTKSYFCKIEALPIHCCTPTCTRGTYIVPQKDT